MRCFRRSVALLPVVLLLAARAPAGTPVHTVVLDSPSYTIDQVYRSMKGPKSTRPAQLEKGLAPELLWITGYSTQIVDAEAGEPVSDEFMCHSNLDLEDPAGHRKRIGRPGLGVRRLFTLSQGQMQVRFPEGFGIPVFSNEAFRFGTQVLNLNEQQTSFGVRHRARVEYVRDRELDRPMNALFQSGVQGLVLLEGKDGYYQVESADPEEHGPGCAVGEAAGGRVLEDNFGRRFAAHWQVPPGRQENRTLVTKRMGLDFDTTIHYIAVHLHPFAESLELRDLTEGESVYKGYAKNARGRVGLESVDHFASAEGIPVHADHEYELVSVYDNPTDETHDAMAVMFLYMHDREFEKPDS